MQAITIAPEYAHLHNPAQQAAIASTANKYAALLAGAQTSPAAPAPAAIVAYETRWWVKGQRRGTLMSSPTTTAAFARRNAAHYASKGYGTEVVSVGINGRKRVIA